MHALAGTKTNNNKNILNVCPVYNHFHFLFTGLTTFLSYNNIALSKFYCACTVGLT